jgi:hypothetical protein
VDVIIETDAAKATGPRQVVQPRQVGVLFLLALLRDGELTGGELEAGEPRPHEAGAAPRIGRRRRRAAEELVAEDGDRVGDVREPIAVGVGSLLAPRAVLALEQAIEDGDGVGEADVAVAIGVAADEGHGGQGGAEEDERQDGQRDSAHGGSS